MQILLTGTAGFIGFHLCKALLDKGFKVIGIDNINDYYDINLKKTRLNLLKKNKNSNHFTFIKEDISNKGAIEKIFNDYEFDIVINMAAQAGVRFSLENPYTYIDSNIYGFLNVLEACKIKKIKHLIYASSSSVYGLNKKQPFSTDDIVDFPISVYAASKKSNELMAHTYSHLFNMPTTGLRFFTVYGPYGRPDMAYFKFTKSIMNEEPIDVFNNGKMKRDFTYIDDIVKGIISLLDHPPINKKNNISNSESPYRVLNIGNNDPISLTRFIEIIEKECSIKAIQNNLPIQPGDVIETHADITEINKLIGFRPSTTIEEGLKKFIDWYKEFYHSDRREI